MRNSATLTLAALIAAAGSALTGCEQTEPADDHTHAPGDGHVHAEGDDHEHAPGDEHDHADEGDTHAHEGEPHDLGAISIGGAEVHATRHGAIAAGAECSVSITLGSDAQPAAVRVWIGTEDARGSLKARADAEGDHYHAHVEAPDPLPEGSALWVEVESAEGERSAGAFPLDG